MIKYLPAVFFILFVNGRIFSNQVYLTLIKESVLDKEGYEIVLYDGIAYVVTGSEVYSFSTSDPYNIQKNIYTFGGTKSIAFTGRTVYTLNGDNSVSYFDLNKYPSDKKGRINTNGVIQKIVIDNGYLYLLNVDAGLQVYDVNISDFPLFKGTQILPPFVNGIFVKDKKAYITGSNANLSIIDVGDISKLPIIGTYTNGVKFFEPYVDGNFAYVPQGNTGVQVLNITKLPFPEWVTNLYARKNAKQVVASNFYIWVCDDKSIEGFFNKDSGFFFAGNYKNNAVINRIALIEGKYIYMVTADKKLKVLKIDYQY